MVVLAFIFEIVVKPVGIWLVSKMKMFLFKFYDKNKTLYFLFISWPWNMWFLSPILRGVWSSIQLIDICVDFAGLMMKVGN